MMPVSTRYVSTNWYQSPEGQEIINSLMHRGTNKRRPFGLLERPIFPPAVTLDEYEYKILVSGKSGVGKTSTVARLSANEVPASHSETPGVQTSIVYWPAKIIDTNKVVMFRLHFWDAGENALKKFDHVLPACKDKADGILFTFSFVDKGSFEDLPQQMSRILEPQDQVCKFVLGTKIDMHAHSEITQRDIREFEANWGLQVLKLKNLEDPAADENASDLNEVVPLLNFICDELWKRDHMIVSCQHRQGSGAHEIAYC